MGVASAGVEIDENEEHLHRAVATTTVPLRYTQVVPPEPTNSTYSTITSVNTMLVAT